jgi:hypothetical protein
MGQKIDLTQQVQNVLPEANGGAGPNTGQRFANAEVPSGTVNGSNTSFALANAPNPALSLLLFLTGTTTRLLQIQGTDYTLSGSSITMSVAPSSPSSLLSWYRYRGFGLTLSFSDGLSMSDRFTIDAPVAQLPMSQTDRMVIIDSLAFSMPPSLFMFSDAMGLSDGFLENLSNPSNMLVGDQLVLTDKLMLGYGDLLTDSLSLLDSLAETLGVPGQFPEVLSDSLTISDSLSIGFADLLTDSLALSDAFIKSTGSIFGTPAMGGTGAFTATSAASPAFNTQVGDLLIACAIGQFTSWGSADPSVSDTAGNTWTPLTTRGSAGATQLKWFYSIATHANAANVITLVENGTGTGSAIFYGYFFDFPMSATPVYDLDTDLGTISTTPASSPAFSPSGVDELILALASDTSRGSTYTAGSGYTLATTIGGSFPLAIGVEYGKFVSPGSGIHATISYTGGTQNSISVLAFHG